MFQEYRGVFLGPLVLCTFAAHFAAIKGHKKIPGLYPTTKLERGGLVLSSVSVCYYICIIHILICSPALKVQRGLRLWAIGAITLQMVKNAKAGTGKKMVVLPQKFALENGSVETMAFNDTTWGAITRARMDFVNNHLRESSLAKAIEKAKESIAPHQDMSVDVEENQDVQMVDLSDDECTLIRPSMSCSNVTNQQK